MIADALVWKYGYAEGLLIRDGKIEQWPKQWPEQPSKTELEVVLSEYTASHKSTEYIEQRKKHYPAVGDQLDAIMKWVDGVAEIEVTPELKSIAMQCMSVKSRFPKHV